MRRSILICDDEEGIRESLKLILEKDHDLAFAESGDDAIQKIKAKPIDIVILDVKMPKKDGLATLKEIRKINPSLKVIIATGYKSADIAQEALQLGASDYIIKPFNRDVIKKTVEKLAL
jgi:YesN/AraC family two-component response regulator